MIHEINNPVICIQASGNVRDKASTWPYTAAAYFDAIGKKTFIFFKAPRVTGYHKTGLKNKCKQYAKQRKVNVIRIDYHINGAEIVKMVSSN